MGSSAICSTRPGCEQMTEPDLNPDRLRFTGEMERTFADAIVEVLGATIVLKACADCGRDPDLHMVSDAVWPAGGLGDGYLCVSCLEQRLGRSLSRSDFTDAQCNSLEFPHRDARLIVLLR